MKITPGLQPKFVVVAAILKRHVAGGGRQDERVSDSDVMFFGDLRGDGDPAAFVEACDRGGRVAVDDLAAQHVRDRRPAGGR